MNDNILKDLKCPVCLEICEDPVETGCCHKLLCQICMEGLENKCVFCRKKCNYASSIIAKRIINSLVYTCEYCEINITRGDKKEHSLKCEKVPVNCPVCKTKNDKDKIFNHLLENHKNELLKNMNQIMNSFQATITNSEKASFSIDTQKNSKGLMARLGESGKYYCGAKLDGARCYCCDGYCGLTSGCNCAPCMELDIKSRNLPGGWLVNSAGFNARKFNQNGPYYCGRRVLVGAQNCDGYCGPTNGPNCEDCQRLDKTSTTRYNRLVN